MEEKKLEYDGFIEVTMEDMKEIHHAPTIDEVIKALECCQSKEKKCKECPLHEFGSGCLDVLIANSHCIVQIGKSEIDRKTDVIDWLSKDIERLEDKNSELQKQVDEYKAKIEHGTLIELGKMPFKIGDTAYWLNGLPNCIQEYKVRGYSFDKLGLRIDLGDLEPLLYKVFGDRLFYSREEAEAWAKHLTEILDS